MKIRIDGEEEDYHTLWREEGSVKMIDQRKLPHKFRILESKNHKETVKAIKDMVTRGAGAIGCAAGYGMAQAAIEASEMPLSDFINYLQEAAKKLGNTRPTAVNLFHAIDRCLKAGNGGCIENRVKKIIEEADLIVDEDLKASREIGRLGSDLIKDGQGILTHCNAGALAFIDYGTALSPIRFANNQGKSLHVWVDETRPRCQGARLTAWELEQEGIPYSLIVDNAAGYYMRRGEVDLVIVGADRVCSTGDVANKIGTYEKAVLAKENNIPFFVAAPEMTFDLNSPMGEYIEIEERSDEEVKFMWGLDEEGKETRVRIASIGSNARNPGFDITPARYITAFITEKGIIYPPFQKSIKRIFT
jgi:S-methyl-5-thioribose-1-phosphate isomerase